VRKENGKAKWKTYLCHSINPEGNREKKKVREEEKKRIQSEKATC